MSASVKILGIETSCDECSASVVEYTPDAIQVLSVATFSQVEIHSPYGGVVPEIASRNHLETILPMVLKALSDAGLAADGSEIDAIAVTNRPGLVGALLVGVSAAKTLAYAWGKPLVPVHHLEGHISSIYLAAGARALDFPCLVAIVSGGHTNLYVMRSHPELWPGDFLKRSLVGRSRDDAAGEAFDKTAKVLGFPYPGGAWIDKKAVGGDPRAFDFPRALPQKSTLDFSFSGLKTAVSLTAEKLRRDGSLQTNLANLCASTQEAIVDALITKISLGIRSQACKGLALVGGVAANSRLRARLATEWQSWGLRTPPVTPPLAYCTDNAAMIAAAGAFRFLQGAGLRTPELLSVNAFANPEM